MEELSSIENKIYEIRGLKVMLDFDLADMYQIETSQLKRAVRRNIERFPEDFMFQLTKEEANTLTYNIRCQNGILEPNWFRYLPFAFTEQGVAMLSGILKTPIAVQVNINIMRAFVHIRQYLSSQIASTPEISELKKELKLLTEQIEEIHEDIESLNKDQANNENLFDDLFNAFAKLSARIQSETTTLERVRVKGFKK